MNTSSSHFMCFECLNATASVHNPRIATKEHECEWCGDVSYGYYVANAPLVQRNSKSVLLEPHIEE